MVSTSEQLSEISITELITAETKASLTKSGLLLFLAGFIIFMGIITGEIYYPREFNTRNSYISELAASMPPETDVPQPSAIIFNTAMIVSGLMIMLAGLYVQMIFNRLLATIPLGIFGLGLVGVGVFPGYIIPWHGIFALVVFISGGIGAITSYKIVRAPLQFIFMFFGLIALFLTVFSKFAVPYLGAGGAERWLLYPVVFWILGLGAYLLGIKDEYQQSLSAKKI